MRNRGLVNGAILTVLLSASAVVYFSREEQLSQHRSGIAIVDISDLPPKPESTKPTPRQENVFIPDGIAARRPNQSMEVRLLRLIPHSSQFQVDVTSDPVRCQVDRCSVSLRQRRDGGRDEYEQFLQTVQSPEFGEILSKNGFSIESMEFGSEKPYQDSYANIEVAVVDPHDH